VMLHLKKDCRGRDSAVGPKGQHEEGWGGNRCRLHEGRKVKTRDKKKLRGKPEQHERRLKKKATGGTSGERLGEKKKNGFGEQQ